MLGVVPLLVPPPAELPLFAPPAELSPPVVALQHSTACLVELCFAEKSDKKKQRLCTKQGLSGLTLFAPPAELSPPVVALQHSTACSIQIEVKIMMLTLKEGAGRERATFVWSKTQLSFH